MTAYREAEADPEFSSFHQVDGNNISCFPIQVGVGSGQSNPIEL